MAGRGSSRVHYCAAEPHFYIARRTVIEYTVIVVFLSSQNIFRDERESGSLMAQRGKIWRTVLKIQMEKKNRK